jgi:integrase
MDPATSNAYLQRLSTMLRWAEREEHLSKNPAVGLRVAAPEGDPRAARLPFSLDQLEKTFGGLAAEEPWRRWITLLGLFTGARLNEICQLAVSDVTRPRRLRPISDHAGGGVRASRGPAPSQGVHFGPPRIYASFRASKLQDGGTSWTL